MQRQAENSMELTVPQGRMVSAPASLWRVSLAGTESRLQMRFILPARASM